MGKTYIILYIIAGVFFFTGIGMLLRQIFSKESPADKKDIAISMLSTILTVVGTLVGIISFMGNKQDLLVNGQERLIRGQEQLIKGQEQLIKGQEQLRNEHIEIIELLREK